MTKKININLSSKVFYLLVIIIIGAVVCIGIDVLAENNPENMGHSLGEIAVFEDCYNGQVLKVYDGELVCDDDKSFSSERISVVQLNVSEICFEEGCSEEWPYDYVVDIPLVYDDHTETDCIRKRGKIMEDDIYSFCKFKMAECPFGWNQFLDWSTTIPIEDCNERIILPYTGPTYDTKFHEFSNTRQEVSYCYTGDPYISAIYAPITETGCY